MAYVVKTNIKEDGKKLEIGSEYKGKNAKALLKAKAIGKK